MFTDESRREGETMGKCYFVSDLHLFANRSNAHQYLEEIVRAAWRADTFVLGGDIFDFRWAMLPMPKAVDRAEQWLRELAACCPGCRFHLVLGNHDYHRDMIDRLVPLACEVSNFSWHRFFLRLGTSVFLHGDVAHRKMNAAKLVEAREKWLEGEQRGVLAGMIYDMVVLTRLHKPMPHLIFSKRLVVRRILKYLESIGQGPADGVRDVYFGHTHQKMSNYYYHGLHFHNGGAPIKGVKFRVIEARV